MALIDQNDILENDLKKTNQLKMIFKRFCRNKMALFGTVVIMLVIFMALFAPVLAPFRYDEQNLRNTLQPPSSTYIFGTDQFGRDVFSRVIYGARISLMVGFGASLLGFIMGGIIGAIAGYFGGVVDNVLMRFVDIILSIPALMMAISISAMLGPGLFNAIIAISIGGVGTFSRITRAAVITVRGNEYIEAAHAIGAGHLRTIRKHVLPNIAAPLIVQVSLTVAGSIMAGAGLSFIGLGIQPPIAEWGSMLAAGRSFIRFNWWLSTFPGLAIMVTVYGFNLMGDGLRDALDPRLKN